LQSNAIELTTYEGINNHERMYKQNEVFMYVYTHMYAYKNTY